MGGQAVDSALGKVFAAEFASLGISVDTSVSLYTRAINLQGSRLSGLKW